MGAGVKGCTQVKGYQESSGPIASCVEDIVKSKRECSFSRMVRSVGGLKRVEVGARVDVGK